MREIFTFLFKTFPAMFSFLERWIDLQEKKLPMKIEKQEERKPVREVDAKWDAERRDDKGEAKDERRELKKEFGVLPKVKEKWQAKKKQKKESRDSRKTNH